MLNDKTMKYKYKYKQQYQYYKHILPIKPIIPIKSSIINSELFITKYGNVTVTVVRYQSESNIPHNRLEFSISNTMDTVRFMKWKLDNAQSLNKLRGNEEKEIN